MILILLVLLILMLLLSVGFFTLLERKLLSLSQLRLGPNKTLYMGVIQPILDGLKLFKKMLFVNMGMLKLFFIIMSFMMFMISMLMWLSFPFLLFENKILMMMWLLLMLGLLSYSILMVGWGSLSKYSFLGGIRSLSQTLSFEVMFALVMMMPFFMINSLSLNFYFNFSIINIFTLILFIILVIMETHRSPMDLSEGESELVSGYNTEMSSFSFVFGFLGEYNSIIFFSMMCMLMNFKFMFYLMIFFLLIMLLIRSCFPRIRYDTLMFMSWFKILPFILSCWFLFYIFKLI